MNLGRPSDRQIWLLIMLVSLFGAEVVVLLLPYCCYSFAFVITLQRRGPPVRSSFVENVRRSETMMLMMRPETRVPRISGGKTRHHRIDPFATRHSFRLRTTIFICNASTADAKVLANKMLIGEIVARRELSWKFSPSSSSLASF